MIYGGMKVYLHTFLTSALDGGEWPQLHALAALPLGKGPWYSLDRRLSGPQSQSRQSGKKKKIPSLCLPENEPQTSSP